MKVLFTTWAWPSHFFPLVPLAWALRAAGHEVRVASGPELAGTIRASGLPAVSVGTPVDFAGEFRARFGTLSARIDLPVRNEPVRLTLESPLGHRGRAVLCSGLQRDGQGWGTLTFSFGF